MAQASSVTAQYRLPFVSLACETCWDLILWILKNVVHAERTCTSRERDQVISRYRMMR